MEHRTHFSKWLMKKGITSHGFSLLLAKELGVDSFPRPTVNAWRSGKATPSLRTWPAIRKITEGELTEQHFVEPYK